MKIVCSIDGGGQRGILPARLLQALDEHLAAAKGTTTPFALTFDLIAGCSTGGIIAAGLCTGVSAKALGDLYAQNGAEIFKEQFGGNALRPKYAATALEAHLKAVLGTAMLSDVTTPELLIPSYCVQYPTPTDLDGDGIIESCGSWFFKSWAARADAANDLPLWEVARATSAAPTYFPTAHNAAGWFIDGGVFANNPAACALAAAHKLWPDEQIKILSLGTGAKVSAIDGHASEGWGLLGWGPQIMTVFMDGASDSVSYGCAEVLGADFLRCEIALEGASDAFDDASPANIANLEKLAAKFVSVNVQRVVDFLKAP